MQLERKRDGIDLDQLQMMCCGLSAGAPVQSYWNPGGASGPGHLILQHPCLGPRAYSFFDT
jgi:hypothetical protein